MDTLSRKMRKAKNELPEEEAWDIAQKTDFAALGTVSEDGWPYTVHVSATAVNHVFYFHSAKKGHKHDNFLFSDRCCLTGALLTITDEVYSYRSFVAFGKLRLVKDPKEKAAACAAMLGRWDPDAEVPKESGLSKADWWAIDVEKITGKSYRHKKKVHEKLANEE